MNAQFSIHYLFDSQSSVNNLIETTKTYLKKDGYLICTLNKEWFTDVIESEENPRNKKFYKNVARFYGDLKGVDKESPIWNISFQILYCSNKFKFT